MTDARREEIARIIAPHLFAPVKWLLDPTPQQNEVLRKADAILATDGQEIVKELVEAGGAMIEAQENDPAGHGRPENIGKQAATCDICQSIGRLAAAHARAKDWLEGR